MERKFESTHEELRAAQLNLPLENKQEDEINASTESSHEDEPNADTFTPSNGSTVEEDDLMPCRFLVELPGEQDERSTLLRPREVPDIENSTRKSWVKGINEFVKPGTEHPHIRPIDFLLLPDGSVDLQDFSDQTDLQCLPTSYPSPYCIPLETISDLEPNERVRRTELFALGSIIYEIYANESPFEGLAESEIQPRFLRAEFPKVTHLPQWPIILSCWSVEFATELLVILSQRGAEEGKFKRFSRAAGNYVSEHPIRFGFQCAGMVAGIGAAIALPILGAAGFGALGPVAGSSAAAWQASMGVVEAGSLFAWCQSAAMGGAAVNGIIAAGAAGGAVFLASTAANLMDGDVDQGDKEKLMELFRKVCRRADG